MPAQSKEIDRRSGRAESDTETSSYEQRQGAGDRTSASRPNAKTPHERDESGGATGSIQDSAPSSKSEISQALQDIERGLIDTDRRGTPADIPAGRVKRQPST